MLQIPGGDDNIWKIIINNYTVFKVQQFKSTFTEVVSVLQSFFWNW